MNFSFHEIDVLLDALKLGAARHEAQARWRPHIARKHDERAKDMRSLQRRLLKRREELAKARLPEEDV